MTFRSRYIVPARDWVEKRDIIKIRTVDKDYKIDKLVISESESRVNLVLPIASVAFEVSNPIVVCEANEEGNQGSKTLNPVVNPEEEYVGENPQLREDSTIGFVSLHKWSEL